MKIGIITKHLDMPVGFGTYATRLLDGLAALDRQNEYVVYSTHAAKRRQWPDNFSFRNFDVPKIRSRETKWDHFTAPLAAKRENVDLIHCLHTATPVPPVRRPVVTNVLDAIGWALPGYRLPAAYNALARRDIFFATHLVTISEASRQDIHRLLRVSLDKVTVTHLAGPDSVVAKTPVKRPYILFVGGTEKRKNLRCLLEAWASQEFGRLGLKIVGSTDSSPLNEDQAALESLLADKQRKRVEWLGRVSEAELDQLYRQATALVFPSLYEGFGLPILEAMARRTPVITSNVSSMPEIAGDAAIVVNPHDPHALAAAMGKLVGDTDLQKDLIGRGVGRARSFTWEKTARATIDVYEKVLS